MCWVAYEYKWTQRRALPSYQSEENENIKYLISSSDDRVGRLKQDFINIWLACNKLKELFVYCHLFEDVELDNCFLFKLQ